MKQLLGAIILALVIVLGVALGRVAVGPTVSERLAYATTNGARLTPVWTSQQTLDVSCVSEGEASVYYQRPNQLAVYVGPCNKTYTFRTGGVDFQYVLEPQALLYVNDVYGTRVTALYIEPWSTERFFPDVAQPEVP